MWGAWGGQAAGEYISGYLIEKSLSVDNVFVWALIMSYFAVPREYQFRVLFWGVFGALVLRFIFIFAGAALLEQFEWMLFVFGGFLIFTAIRLLRHDDEEIHPENNPVLKLVRTVVPSTSEYHGQAMFIREAGKRLATPLFAVLVVIETSDVIFAVDSIPAILAVSREQFIVFSSNAFAILGLRALYFLLADLRDKFDYLQTGLAVILAFVGVQDDHRRVVPHPDVRLAGRHRPRADRVDRRVDQARPDRTTTVPTRSSTTTSARASRCSRTHDGASRTRRRPATDRAASALEDEAAVVAEELRDVGGGLGLAAAVEGRLRVVLDAELEHLAEVVAADLAGEGERHVDARAHAGGGDDLAVDHHALVGRGWRRGGRARRGPASRWWRACPRAGRRRRARASRCTPTSSTWWSRGRCGASRGSPRPSPPAPARAAGHEEDVGPGDVVEGGVGDEGERPWCRCAWDRPRWPRR